MKRSTGYIAILALVFLKLVMLSSCANIMPPSGGLRDSLPPKLVLAVPRDSALNVSVGIKNIVLTFDEYVTLQGVSGALIVSPNMKNTPFVDSKLRTVTIKMRDTLEPNTTYSFDFGDAIKDVNESNVAKNFSYVFSTGKTIDNNTYSGKVIEAETGKIDSTLIVLLHRDLSDSAIMKLRPRYYTRLNGKGEFTFKHLPAGSFRVYAIKSSYQNTYSDSTSLFAFRTEPLVIAKENKGGDTLFAYATLKKAATRPAVGTPLKLPGGKEDKRLRYMVNLDNGQQDLLSNTLLSFNRRLHAYDSSAIQLYDTNYTRLNGYTLSLDSAKTVVALKYPWKEHTAYRLIIAKEAATDSAGTSLSKSDTLHFITKKETEYGSIRLRFSNLDLSANPVLQILSNDKLVESVPLTTMEFRRKLFHAATYDLRILYDHNRNGIWDPGDFSKKIQPETVQLIPKQVTIRANWDNEINISL